MEIFQFLFNWSPLARDPRICLCIFLHIFSLKPKPTKPATNQYIRLYLFVFFFNTLYDMFFFFFHWRHSTIILSFLMCILCMLTYVVWDSLYYVIAHWAAKISTLCTIKCCKTVCRLSMAFVRIHHRNVVNAQNSISPVRGKPKDVGRYEDCIHRQNVKLAQVFVFACVYVSTTMEQWIANLYNWNWRDCSITRVFSNHKI